MIHEPIAVLPVIPAERFVLRPLRRSDAGLISLFAADERVARGTRTIPHPLPPGTTEGFIARSMSDRRDSDIWALDGTAQDLDELLGIVTLTPVRDDQSEVSYWVAPGLWNAGFASEAVTALVAANPHRSRSLVAEVFQDNPASARVLTRAGFAYLGDAETWSVARGAKVATWTYLRKMG